MPNPSALHTLNSLGWEWRQNGAVLSVCIDGHCYRVLIPIERLWATFGRELAKAGAPMPAAVGALPTVGGLFSGIAHAVSKAAGAATHAVTRAASTVARDAASVAQHATRSIPVVNTLVKSATNLLALPSSVVDQLASGGRVDRVALGALKNSIAQVKAVAPYAQTVIGLVPGVGTGLSGAIGAGLALAQGQSITDALMAGVRGALPGGAAAQAAFDMAHAAMQGKPIDEIALGALPISPSAKQALADGVHVARDLAAGRNVSQAVIDAATRQLPPDIQKAVQIGTALAHAKNLQGAVAAVPMAASLAQQFAAGQHAAAALRALPPRAVKPPALLQAVKTAQTAHQSVMNTLHAAAAGHPQAIALAKALSAHARANPAIRPGYKAARPRYHQAASVSGPFHLYGQPHATRRVFYVPSAM